MFVKLNVVCLHYIDPVLCHQHVSDAVIYCNFTLLIALGGKPNHLCSGKSGSYNSGNSIGYMSPIDDSSNYLLLLNTNSAPSPWERMTYDISSSKERGHLQ